MITREVTTRKTTKLVITMKMSCRNVRCKILTSMVESIIIIAASKISRKKNTESILIVTIHDTHKNNDQIVIL